MQELAKSSKLSTNGNFLAIPAEEIYKSANVVLPGRTGSSTPVLLQHDDPRNRSHRHLVKSTDIFVTYLTKYGTSVLIFCKLALRITIPADLVNIVKSYVFGEGEEDLRRIFRHKIRLSQMLPSNQFNIIPNGRQWKTNYWKMLKTSIDIARKNKIN
jgi:hypothetical protein